MNHPAFFLKKSLFVFCFLLVSFLSICQDKHLYQRYSDEKDIDRKASIALELWNYYLRNDLDSLKINGFDLLLLGIEHKNHFAINVGKRSVGSYFVRSGKPKEGIRYLKEARTYFEKKGDQVLLTEILNEIGNGYLNWGKPVKAEEFYLSSLREGKESPDHTSAYLAESNLAQAYIAMNNLDKASAILHHYKNAALKDMKLESVSNAYALLGTIEQQKGNNKLALEYYRKSADFGKKTSSKAQIAHAYNNSAIVHFIEGRTDEALENFTAAYKLRAQTGNARSVCESLFNLGEYYLEMKDFSKAESFYRQSIEAAKNADLLKEELDGYRALASMYGAMGDHIRSAETYEVVLGLQEKYYSELSEENSVEQEMITTVNEMESDLKRSEEELRSGVFGKKGFGWVIPVLVVSSLVLLGLVVYLYRRPVSSTFPGTQDQSGE